ncbi:hypothetical protein SNE40_019721 [Patella caerulea]
MVQVLATSTKEKLTCPPCHCIEKGRKLIANCTSLGLRKIPNKIPNDATHLILRNNSLHLIHNHTFGKFYNLKHLDLSLCNITKIGANGFAKLYKLDKLILSNNKNMGFQTLGDAMFGLQNTVLRVLIANSIVPTYAVCVCISKQMLKYFNHTKIQEIHVSYNRIEIFEPGALQLLPSTLKIVEAQNNRFTIGPYLKDVVDLTNLEDLDLSDNLDSPELDAYIPEANLNWASIADEDCGDHLYQYRPTLPVSQLPFHLSPNLITLRVNFAEKAFRITKLELGANNSLRHVYLSRNVLSRLEGPVSGVNSIQTLDISYNFCNFVTANFFVNFTSLQKLDLSHNNLQQVIANKSLSIFRHLHNVTHLSLVNNNLLHLPRNVFAGLKNCRVLNISLNLLTSSKFNIFLDGIDNLTHLDFSSNRLQWFSPQFREVLDASGKKGGHLTVDLTNNPLYCTCVNFEFLQWLLVKREHLTFHNFENYQCVFTNGTTVYLKHSKLIFEEFSKVCQSKIGMIVTYVSSVVTILGFLTGSVLYRFRWKLRYLYYSARRSNKIHHENDVVFEFDAFISYSEDARLFVDQIMRLKVEEEAGLKLCLHNRDFLPSLPIAEGIVTAVKTSRKTVLVMSPDFVKSYWCLYEMNIADMESQHTERDVLLILLYKHIKYDQIPSTVMYQIKSHTYIEYPNTDYDSNEMCIFWDNFSRAIKS